MYEVIKTVQLFRNLNDFEIEKFMGITENLRLEAGAFIFKKGANADTVYVVVEGSVKITKPGSKDDVISIIKRGEYFGEMGLLDDSPRSTDAHVETDCKLLTVNRANLLALMEADHDFGYKFMHNMAKTLAVRLRTTTERV